MSCPNALDRIHYMYIAHRSTRGHSKTGRALEWPVFAASGSRWAFLEGLVDGARRLAKGFFETGDKGFGDQAVEIRQPFMKRTGWQRIFMEAPLDLLPCASHHESSGEDEVASAEEAGEGHDAQEETNGGQKEQHRALTLTDGTHVPVREIQPNDASALKRLWERLSERTIRLRYMESMDELSNEKARHLAEVDGEDQYALVALDPVNEEEIVAVVRYDREPGTERAEYAALVEDRLQGLGLGIGLTRALVEAARERGVQSFDAYVSSKNTGMLHLLRSLDLPERERKEDGRDDSKRVEVDLFPNNGQ